MALYFSHRDHAPVRDFAYCMFELNGGVIDGEVGVEAGFYLAKNAFAG